MEKRVWTKPQATVEQFEMNEYIAACGDENKVYKFTCDAPAGTLYYYRNGDGTVDGNYTGTDSATRLGSYHPCNEKHEAATTNPFYDGFVDRNGNGKCDTNEAVIVWRGANGRNGHATASLDMNTWETAKS